jgi:hypothetical protein
MTMSISDGFSLWLGKELAELAIAALVVLALFIGAVIWVFVHGRRSKAPMMSRIDKDLAFKGAQAIGRLPEAERLAVMELLSAAKDTMLWRLCWPGFLHIIQREAEDRPKRQAQR